MPSTTGSLNDLDSPSEVILHHHYIHHHYVEYPWSGFSWPTIITPGQFQLAPFSHSVNIGANENKHSGNNVRRSSLIVLPKNEPLALEVNSFIMRQPHNQCTSTSSSSSSLYSSPCPSSSVSGASTPYFGSSSSVTPHYCPVWPYPKCSEVDRSPPLYHKPLESLETQANHLVNYGGSFNSIPMVPFYSNVDQPWTTIAPAQMPVPASGQAPVPTIPLKHFYAQLGVFYQPVPWNQSFGMERVWMYEFRRIFSNFYNELWSIQPVDKKPNTNSNAKLHMFVDSAKVRFCCERCSHSWTSMKGRVVFWFNLLQPNFNVGIVAIKLFGQRCEACNLDNSFEQPMWYPEEVTKVLMNLYNRVGQIFYGFEKTKYERQRRMGKPRTQHNKFLCQACMEGICLNRGFNRTRNSDDNNVEINQIESDSECNNRELQSKHSDHHSQPYDSEDSGVVDYEVSNTKPTLDENNEERNEINSQHSLARSN